MLRPHKICQYRLIKYKHAVTDQETSAYHILKHLKIFLAWITKMKLNIPFNLVFVQAAKAR